MKTLIFTGLCLTPSLLQGVTQPPISDGQPIFLKEDKIWITPPQGWEVLENQLGKALILQEKKSEKVVYGKPTYQRNITVAVTHEGTPIDEIAVQKLRQDLTESFGKYGENFSLSEKHEYFDYRHKKDGIIIYSFLKVNGFDLTQIHVFVSGEAQSVLLTYTDLSDRFQEDQGMFTTAWNTIASVQVEGVPAGRFTSLYTIGATISLILFSLLAFSLVRTKRAKKAYELEEDSLFNDDEDLEDSSLEAEQSSFGESLEGDDEMSWDSSLPETRVKSLPPATSW